MEDLLPAFRAVAEGEHTHHADALVIGATALGAVDGVIVVEPNGRYLAVNDAICELTGYDADEIRRLAPGNLNAYPDEGICHRGETLHGLRRTYTSHLLHKDGSTIPVHVFATVGHYEGQRVIIGFVWPRGA